MLVMAGAGLATTALLGAAFATEQPVALFWIDEGVSEAESAGESQKIDQQSTRAGVTLTVTGVVADSFSTTVAIQVTGREDLGDTAAPTTLELQDADGQRWTPFRASSVPGRSREWNITFPSLEPEGGEYTLAAPSVAFSSSQRMRDHAALGLRPPAPTIIHGPWAISLSIDARAEAVQAQAPAGAFAYGPANLVIDQVSIDTTGTIITGEVHGFAVDVIPDIVMAPAFLVSPGGERLRLLSGRSGFGEGRRRFEFRFERAPGQGYELEIPFHVAGVSVAGTAMNPVAAAGLAAHAGTVARVPIDLPE